MKNPIIQPFIKAIDKKALKKLNKKQLDKLNKILKPPALQASWTGLTEIKTAAKPPKAV